MNTTVNVILVSEWKFQLSGCFNKICSINSIVCWPHRWSGWESGLWVAPIWQVWLAGSVGYVNIIISCRYHLLRGISVWIMEVHTLIMKIVFKCLNEWTILLCVEWECITWNGWPIKNNESFSVVATTTKNAVTLDPVYKLCLLCLFYDCLLLIWIILYCRYNS